MSSTTNSTFLMSPNRPLWDPNSSESSNGDSYPEKVVISLVDDDESVRSALKRLIKSVGLKVECVRFGRRLFELCNSFRSSLPGAGFAAARYERP